MILICLSFIMWLWMMLHIYWWLCVCVCDPFYLFIYLFGLHISVEHLLYATLASRCICNIAMSKSHVYCRSWVTNVGPFSLFVKFYWNVVMLICVHIVYNAFELPGHSWVVSPETLVPAKSKYLLFVFYRKSLLVFGLLRSMGMLIFFLHVCNMALCIKEIVSCGCFPVSFTDF